MKEPSWIIVAIVGAILGWAIPLIGKFLRHLLPNSEDDYLLGDWYGYHWTYKNGQPILNTSQWKITKGRLHRLCVQYAHQDGMAYRGYIEKERSQLVVRIHSGKNHETARFRFTWPIPSKAKLLSGIWLSFDHDTKIASGAHILSKKKLSKSDATVAIENSMSWEKDLPVMKVNN